MSVDITSGSAHVFLSCGEASGDRYGAALVAALRRINPRLRFSALGGAALAEAGVEIIQPSEPIAVMGFGEILTALPRILEAKRRVARHLAATAPDLCVTVDFPGFNLALGRAARSRGVPVFHLIAPQLWAWGGWRIGNLRRSVDRVGAVLPFEREFFAARGIDVVHLGHPLMEDYPRDATVRLRRRREERLAEVGAPLTVGLLPGSRRQEVSRLKPVYVAVLERLRAGLERPLRTIVSAAPGLDRGLLAPATAAGFEIREDRLPDLLPQLDLALVCSGTASLETALAYVPHALVYRTSAFNFFLGRRLVRIDRIGLANLVLGKDAVPEFVQEAATPEALADDLSGWLRDGRRRAVFDDRIDRLRTMLGEGGFWDRAAAEVARFAAGKAARP